MNKCLHTELSSHEGTRSEFNPGKAVIKLGIDVHQEFYVVVVQEGAAIRSRRSGSKRKRFCAGRPSSSRKAARRCTRSYEACGFGFGLQRQLAALGIACHVVCPQKLDERNKRVKTDGLDAKALCLKLDRFVEGNREALAVVRVPTRGGRTAARHSPAARATGQSAQATGSPGAQFDGQSRDRAGEELVETAHLCRALRARSG